MRGSFIGRQAVHWFWCGSYLSMLERCDTPLCPPTTNMKPSMTPTPKLILLSAMGATISQASLLGSYRSTLCGADTAGLTKKTQWLQSQNIKLVWSPSAPQLIGPNPNAVLILGSFKKKKKNLQLLILQIHYYYYYYFLIYISVILKSCFKLQTHSLQLVPIVLVGHQIWLQSNEPRTLAI